MAQFVGELIGGRIFELPDGMTVTRRRAWLREESPLVERYLHAVEDRARRQGEAASQPA